MDTVAAWRQAAAATAVGAVVLGLAWRDSLLIALACVAGFRLLMGWLLQGRTDLEAWRASLRCIGLGLLGLTGAALLITATVGALMGWWVIAHPYPGVVVVALLLAGASLAAARVDRPAAWREVRTWGVLGAWTAVALLLADAGYVAMPCLLVAGIGAHLGWNAWVLAHVIAGELMRGGERFP